MICPMCKKEKEKFMAAYKNEKGDIIEWGCDKTEKGVTTKICAGCLPPWLKKGGIKYLKVSTER